jgi:hypothetical protein
LAVERRLNDETEVSLMTRVDSDLLNSTVPSSVSASNLFPVANLRGPDGKLERRGTSIVGPRALLLDAHPMKEV